MDINGFEITNPLDISIRFRPEHGDDIGYILPPHTSVDMSVDAVQNPYTFEWTKFKGESFIPIDNDISFKSDGTPICIGGQCSFFPSETRPEIDDYFGNPDLGFSDFLPEKTKSNCGKPIPHTSSHKGK